MNSVLEQLSNIGIVPVIKIDRAKDALPLANALIKGGLPCAEVTFRTDAAEEAIRAISSAYPEMLVGAGTVLTTKQADTAVNAGAKFIVSPGFNSKVVAHCIKMGYPITPGISSPSEIEQAIEMGLGVVKFFPAEAAGGLAVIKAMSAPYAGIKFIPTGGINLSNFKSYLDFPKVLACGGSWMVSADMINSGDFEGIERLTSEAVKEMLGFNLAHIGINCKNEAEARGAADSFSSIFGFKNVEGLGGILSGNIIELLKSPYLGKKGHIAIKTNYINRAIYHLELKGVSFSPESTKYNAKGGLNAIYLLDEIGGFAVHLLQA